MTRVLIVGATSGIAQATAHAFARRGWTLLLAGRDLPALDALAADLAIRYGAKAETIAFEALRYDTHEHFFASACERFGGLDGILLCYGYLGSQRLGERSFDEARAILETNYMSCVSVLEQAAAYFEVRRSGFIAAISSVAGDRGRQSNYLYGSAKGALSLYLQGLRNRLAKAGVPVTTIKPGFVDTRMTAGQEGMFLVASPERVAEGIAKAIVRRRHVVYLPGFWRWIMLVIRSIPEFAFKRLTL